MLKLKNHKERLEEKDYNFWLSKNKEFLPLYFEKLQECMEDHDLFSQKELNYEEFCFMLYKTSKN